MPFRHVKVGDKIELHGVVKVTRKDEDGFIWIEMPNGSHTPVNPKLGFTAKVIERVIAAGDQVRNVNSGYKYTVRATNGNQLWLADSEGYCSTYNRDDVEFI